MPYLRIKQIEKFNAGKGQELEFIIQPGWLLNNLIKFALDYNYFQFYFVQI